MTTPKHCPHCGCAFDQHSTPQRNRYFAVIRALYMHWPERHLITGAAIEFQPEDETHLRKWLQVKAGYKTVTTVEVPSADPAITKLVMLATESIIKAAGGYAFIRPHGDGLAVFTSRSIKVHALSGKEFTRLNDAVAEVIANETGHDPEQLLRETERAA